MFAIRTGNFQLSLMLAMALAVLVLPMAAEAYTPEGRQACTGDALRLCSAEIPNVDRVRACLHELGRPLVSPGFAGCGFCWAIRTSAGRFSSLGPRGHYSTPLAVSIASFKL
jgi:hypothetical protein